jgi:hypothetical protein
LLEHEGGSFSASYARGVSRDEGKGPISFSGSFTGSWSSVFKMLS